MSDKNEGDTFDTIEELKNENRQLKERISQLEDEKALFLEASYDGYWDWKLKEDYEYMSPRFWEIFGVDHRTKKHSPSEWQHLIHPDDLLVALKNLEQHISTRGEHPYVQEVRYKHSQGHWCTVLCRGRIIEWSEDGEALRMVGTHTDISYLKSIQEELKESNSYLEAFAYSASHDLQEPLRTMSSYSKYLLQDLDDKLSDDNKEDLHFIIDASERLRRLIESLLVYSRIGRSTEARRWNRTEDVLAALLGDLSELISRNKATIKVEAVPDVFGIEMEVRAVFLNLIVNAIKYNDREPKIAISGNIMGNFAEFRVEDNGRGIALEYQDKIFEVFRRGDNMNSGSGVGLASCKKIVEAHGGTITVRSSPGEGSVFTISFSNPTVDSGS